MCAATEAERPTTAVRTVTGYMSDFFFSDACGSNGRSLGPANGEDKRDFLNR